MNKPILCGLLLALVQGAQADQPAPNLACTDFNAYVNGEWEARTELPADRARIGSFDLLRTGNDKLLEAALAELVAQPQRQSSPGLKRLAAFYRAGMDEAGIEKRGLAALAPLLAKAGGVTRETLPAVLGELSRWGIDQPLRIGIGFDLADSTRHLINLWQGGLGLPDRDDYFNSDSSSQRLKAGYRIYVQRLMQAAGSPLTEAELDAVLALETEIARAHMNPVQRRNPQAVNNRRTPAALAAQATGFDWKAWLLAYTGGAEVAEFNLAQPDVARALAATAQQAPLAAWRHYLRLRVLDQYAAGGPQALAQAHFDYRSGVVRGLKSAPPRVERVIATIGGNNGSAPMGEALGELYVSKAFSPLAQQRALLMVEDIRAAMKKRISNSPWMSSATQTAALAKLDAMVAQIGAPARWRGYESLVIEPDDYLGNQLRVDLWFTQQRLAEWPKPVDRSRWNTSANTVNAFAAAGNRIVFPAGILQPPFFDANADDASNFGAIGAVIGHEITHHFDDRGRQFDAVGNLRDWWAPADAAAYKTRAERVAQLFSSYEPLPGVRINGHQMLGENISDFGGLHIAFDGLQIALERARKASGKAAPLVNGQTPEQRFFTANAIIWRGKMREEALLNQLRTGQHSPGRYRVLGPISHMPAFATAFGCKAGDAMVAADPIVIW
jgi:putative endopeptidase